MCGCLSNNFSRKKSIVAFFFWNEFFTDDSVIGAPNKQNSDSDFIEIPGAMVFNFDSISNLRCCVTFGKIYASHFIVFRDNPNRLNRSNNPPYHRRDTIGLNPSSHNVSLQEKSTIHCRTLSAYVIQLLIILKTVQHNVLRTHNLSHIDRISLSWNLSNLCAKRMRFHERED